MRITGTATLEADPQRVWQAFHDPAVLARCLPGCERLDELAPDRYAMTVTAGVAAIKGTYEGTVSLGDPHPPESFTMNASGAGAPGTVDADVVVRLTPTASGGTEVVYEADASVGGAIGGVGQRMLSGVTRKMAGQLFSAVDRELTGEPSADVVVNPTDGTTEPSPASGRDGAPRSYAGAAAYPPSDRRFALEGPAGFAAGAAVGGLLALIGVAVGARVGRRR